MESRIRLRVTPLGGVFVSARKVSKEKSTYSLALKIADLMRGHVDRWEAIDALDIARILFREKSKTAQSRPEDPRSFA